LDALLGYLYQGDYVRKQSLIAFFVEFVVSTICAQSVCCNPTVLKTQHRDKVAKARESNGRFMINASRSGFSRNTNIAVEHTKASAAGCVDSKSQFVEHVAQFFWRYLHWPLAKQVERQLPFIRRRRLFPEVAHERVLDQITQ
jgi:hypothetical protein